MATWLDLVSRAEGLRAIFGATIPRLDAIRLHEIRVHRDGPTVTLRFDLAEFPASPPRRWHPGFDVVQIELAFGDVSAIALARFGRDDVGRLRIDPGLAVELLVDEAPTLRLACSFAYLHGISAYQRGDREARSEG